MSTPATSDVHTIECFTKWSDARARLEAFDPRWVFRGQSSNAYELKTSLERAAEGTPLYIAEKSIERSFRRRAHHYLESHHMPSNRLDWLALMQHHGAPTRLLDWTHSPHVAAYFAAEHAKEWWSVWAVDAIWCKEQGSRNMVRLAVSEGMHPNDAESKFGGLRYMDYEEEDYSRQVFLRKAPGVYPLEPFITNPRLTIQQGLFLALGDMRMSFVQNLLTFDRTEAKEHVVRIDVPLSQRPLALADLDRMNINRASLFPGLDGFAQSLQYKLAVSQGVHLRNQRPSRSHQ